MGRPLIAVGVPFRRGGFTQITNDYITRVYAEGGTLTDTEKSAINTLTLNPDIAEFDRLWVHGLQNEIAARTSVVNALTADLITNVNSTTFTAGEGFQGNGTTMYLNTNYNPSVDGVKYTLNSASFLSYFPNGINVAGYQGNFNGTTGFFWGLNAGTLNGGVNDSSEDISSINSSVGLCGFIRSSSTNKNSVLNGILSSNITRNSIGIPNLNIYLLCSNNNGAISFLVSTKLAFSSIGSGAIDQSQFYTDVLETFVNIVAFDLSTSTKDWVREVYSNGGTVTRTEALAVNTFLNSIQKEEFDRLWIHGLSNETAARVSIINPTSTPITNVNSTTFTAGEGFQGNGTTMYLDTNYNPAVDGVKYTLNSASFGVYSLTSASYASDEIGATNGASISVIDTNYLGSSYTLVNSSTGAVFANGDGSGFFAAERINNTSESIYINGVSLNTSVSNSISLINFNFYIFARNNSGTSINYSPRKIAFTSIGSGAIDQSSFYTATQTLGTTLGWAV